MNEDQLGSEKIPGAYSGILQGTDDQGREVFQVLTFARDGIDVHAAAACGQVITEEEVRGWFTAAGARAGLPDPPSPHLSSLAHNLNILRVTADMDQLRTPEDPRVDRVKRALLTLQEDLPALIEGGRRSQALAAEQGRPAFLSAEQQAAVERLHEAVVEALPSFHFRAPAKRRQPWHAAADLIASSAVGAWRAAGSRPLGVGKPTSPAVVVTAAALERIGVRDADGEPVAPEAVSKALARRNQDLDRFRVRFTFTPDT